jgi:hypothetical protein
MRGQRQRFDTGGQFHYFPILSKAIATFPSLQLIRSSCLCVFEIQHRYIILRCSLFFIGFLLTDRQSFRGRSALLLSDTEHLMGHGLPCTVCECLVIMRRGFHRQMRQRSRTEFEPADCAAPSYNSRVKSALAWLRRSRCVHVPRRTCA